MLNQLVATGLGKGAVRDMGRREGGWVIEWVTGYAGKEGWRAAGDGSRGVLGKIYEDEVRNTLQDEGTTRENHNKRVKMES